MDPNVYKQLMQLFAPQTGNGFSMNGPVAPQGPVPQGGGGGGYDIMQQLGAPPIQSPITNSPTVQSTSTPPVAPTAPFDPFANFSGMDSWNMDRINEGKPWWTYGNAGDINKTGKDIKNKILTEGEGEGGSSGKSGSNSSINDEERMKYWDSWNKMDHGEQQHAIRASQAGRYEGNLRDQPNANYDYPDYVPDTRTDFEKYIDEQMNYTGNSQEAKSNRRQRSIDSSFASPNRTTNAPFWQNALKVMSGPIRLAMGDPTAFLGPMDAVSNASAFV